ncbi:MAG: hypothetical protein RSA98_02340 [Odoribacter sp.]
MMGIKQLSILGKGFLCFLLVFCWACGSDDDTVTPEKPGIVDNPLQATSLFYEAPIRGGEKLLILQAKYKWEVKIPAEYASWVDVSPKSGEASEKTVKMTVSVKKNMEAFEGLREAQFKIAVTEVGIDTALTFKISQMTGYYLQQDSLALVSISKKLNGKEWIKKWDANTPLQQWYGVVAEEVLQVPRVIGVWFGESNNLQGDFPEEFGNLTALQAIQIKGEAKLTGKLPGEALSKCKNLQKLWIYSTKMSGEIPASLSGCRNMDAIVLDANHFSSIAADFGDFPNLQGLSIINNPITGSVNTNWFKKMPKLALLNLKRNDFSGELPADIIGGLPSLVSVQLAGNRFTGAVPPSIRSSGNWKEDAWNPMVEICPQQNGYGFSNCDLK